MKIKKVNELVEYSEDELKSIRNRKFPNETIEEYYLWGESLKFMTPEYTKLYTGNSIEECINYYHQNKQNSNSRMYKYTNVLLIEKSTTVTQLDLDMYLNSNKYNI